MARVINQNNEVIARKNENEKKTREPRERKPVAKGSILIGAALAVAAIVVIVALIVYFTQKEDPKPDHVPTILEQYVDEHQGSVKNSNEYKIVFDDKINVEKVEREEFFVLIYDKFYADSFEVDSEEYEQWLELDQALVDTFCKKLVNSDVDLKLYIAQMNTVVSDDQVTTIKLHGCEEFQIQSPMLIHVSPRYDDNYELIADGSKKISKMTGIIKSFTGFDYLD